MRPETVTARIRELRRGERPGMLESVLHLPVWGLGALAGVMVLAWLRQRATRNAGLVDVIWSGSLGGLAILYVALAEGWWPRRLLVGALAAIWSIRLTVHLWRRVAREDEDGRYADLRRDLGPRIDVWLFWFFQIQALLAVLLSLAVLVPMAASAAGFGARDVVAVVLWITSIVGELVADEQLRRWREDPANRGRTCRSGLWRYSRHPNYFFEWIHWLAYPVFAIGLPFGWAVWLAPAVMLYLVTKVTGIPPTEQQSVRSRGDDYREYQRTTNAFFPGPPRPDRSGSHAAVRS